MDYFDDDELINDYMEDDDFEPERQDIPEDMFDEHFEDQGDKDALQGSSNPANEALPETSPLSDAGDGSRSRKRGFPFEIKVQGLSPKHPDQSLYTYERYCASSHWRPLRNQEAFEAREWNRGKAPIRRKSVKKSISAGPLLSSCIRQHLEPLRIVIKSGSKTETSNFHGVSKLPLEGQPSVAMTVSGGFRIHVATNHPSTTPRELSSVVPTLHKGHHHLLGVSIATLMTRCDKIAVKQKQGRRASKQHVHPMNDSQLWVDKHAPSAFSHLLSDEQTNRNVLRALRAWDPYVFQKNAPKSPFPANETQEPPTNPRDIRPPEAKRVLLISGPPGVGKTTLAHIVARHAGYEPLEVNASDDRSASVLQDKVLRAMESTTLTSHLQLCGKPNCIILDEVDGADAKNAISSLVEIIRADISEKGSTRKRPFLRRPIIFICNHKYVPTLRPLLRYCQHFDVEAPTDQRLVARLRAILAKERLSSNASSLLNNLVVNTGGDIRSCLFTLQYAAAKARSLRARQDIVVDISTILSSILGGDGVKDTRTDLASTMAFVFKKTKKMDPKCSESSLQRVLSVVESYGEHTKTLECLFTNLLSVPYIDPTMERCMVAHEWLSGGVNIAPISSATAAAIHVLCRIDTRPEIVLFNKESSNAYFQRESNMGILQRFSEGLKQSSLTHSSTEIVPYVLWLLSATDLLHRPVSSIALLSKKELAAFHAHVQILRSLGLTYMPTGASLSSLHQELESAFDMRLEPEIERLVQFKGYKPSPEMQRKRVPSVLRELLAHEANVENIRARDLSSKRAVIDVTSTVNFRQKPNGRDLLGSPRKSNTSVPPGVPPCKKLKVDPTFKTFLGIRAEKSKALRKERKKALIGFNNPSCTGKLTHTGSGIPLNQVVRFKYQKGFTQAVRTVCRMEDLM